MRFEFDREKVQRFIWGGSLALFSVFAVVILKGHLLAVANYYDQLLGMVWWLFLWLGAWLLASTMLLVTRLYWTVQGAPTFIRKDDGTEVLSHPLLKDLLFIEEVSTAVGALGTFLALYDKFIGLVFDLANLMATAQALVQGIGKSLLTSVVGIIGFLLAKYLRERIAPKIMMRHLTANGGVETVGECEPRRQPGQARV